MYAHSTSTGRKADGFRRIEIITGFGRRRWTDEVKAWIFSQSLERASTVSAVARRYGLHASQLSIWRQRLAVPAHEIPEFVPVGVCGGRGGDTGRDCGPDEEPQSVRPWCGSAQMWTP